MQDLSNHSNLKNGTEFVKIRQKLIDVHVYFWDYTILDGVFDILAFQLHPHIYMNIWSMPLLLIAARVSTRVPRDPATLYKYSLDTKKVMQSSLDQKA